MTNGVFSDFEIDQMSVKFSGVGESAIAMNCVGSVEEEMTAREVTKKCRGVVIKDMVRGTGEGTLTISAHVPIAIFKKAFGMDVNGLASGVNAYGINSRHRTFCLTMHVVDEDGAEKYKAYPNCICKARPTITTENGSEEVAEIEMEVAVMPDENGNGMFEALATEITSTIKNAWMDSFSSDLVDGGTAYSVTNTLTNCSTGSTITRIPAGGNFFATYTADAGYNLPSTITVRSGQQNPTTLVAGTGYLWNNTNGSLYVPNVSGALTITITATA